MKKKAKRKANKQKTTHTTEPQVRGNRWCITTWIYNTRPPPKEVTHDQQHPRGVGIKGVRLKQGARRQQE